MNPKISFIVPPGAQVLDANRRLQDLSAELAQEMARMLDEKIRGAITLHIGPDWTPEAVIPRMHRIVTEDGGFETLFLDGAPILNLGPVRAPTFSDGTSAVSRAFAIIPPRPQTVPAL